MMGIYVFKSKTANYLKVGYTKYDNPWDRAENKYGGFETNRNPPALSGHVSADNLELIGWFPHGSEEQEKAFHTLYASERACGEWYDTSLETHFMYSLKLIFKQSKHQVIQRPAKKPSMKNTGGYRQTRSNSTPTKNPLLTDAEWAARKNRRRRQ